MNIKLTINNYLNESYSNRKYLGLYFLFILVIFLSMMNMENYIHPKMEIIVFIFATIFGFFIIDYHTLHENELYKTAFILITVTGVFLAIFTPIGLIPDEHEHFARSVITATGNLFPQFSNAHNGFSTIGLVNQIASNEGKTFFNSAITSVPIDYSSIYYRSAFQHVPFYGYLLQGFGVLIAELLGLPAIGALWLSRIFNVLLYACLASFAIRKTPILKVPLFIISCAPMVMFITGSASVDVLVNGLIFVIIAYFLYFYKSDIKISRKELLTFFILVCLVGCCKPTFFALFLLIFLIPKDKFEKNYYIYTILSFILLLVIMCVFYKFFISPNTLNSFRLDYAINTNSNSTLQFNYLLNHIPEALILLFQLPNYLSSLFLDLFSFSFLDYRFGSSFINGIYPLFLGALFLLYPYKNKISNLSRIGVFAVVCIIFIGTYFVFLLTWTPVGNLSNILGVQSRYFVPLFALLPLCLNFNNRSSEVKKIDKIYIIFAIGFLVALLFITIITWY